MVLHASHHDEPEQTPPPQQTFHWLCLDNLPIDEFYKADASFIRQHLAKHLQESRRDGLIGALLSLCDPSTLP